MTTVFDIDTICENSFANFHTKGLDYLCLTRTPELTRKVYFFEGDLADLPEVVMPHDHRYDFTTTVLSGAVRNRRFMECNWVINAQAAWNPKFVHVDRFLYDTPLNGGSGFKWAGETYLVEMTDTHQYRPYTKGDFYHSSHDDIHTLDIRCEGTVILLEQKADVVPLGQPTKAFRPVGDNTLPETTGLYDKMTPDQAVKRIEQFLDLIGNR